MRVVVLLAVIPFITATALSEPVPRQDGDIPECANECFSQADAQTTDCKNGDTQCLCEQPEVTGFIASCIQSSCSTRDLESAAQYGLDLCAAAANNTGAAADLTPSSTSSGSYSATGSSTSTSLLLSSAQSTPSSNTSTPEAATEHATVNATISDNPVSEPSTSSISSWTPSSSLFSEPLASTANIVVVSSAQAVASSLVSSAQAQVTSTMYSVAPALISSSSSRSGPSSSSNPNPTSSTGRGTSTRRINLVGALMAVGAIVQAM